MELVHASLRRLTSAAGRRSFRSVPFYKKQPHGSKGPVRRYSDGSKAGTVKREPDGAFRQVFPLAGYYKRMCPLLSFLLRIGVRHVFNDVYHKLLGRK